MADNISVPFKISEDLPHLRLASPWQRLTARLTDGIYLIIPAFAILFLPNIAVREWLDTSELAESTVSIFAGLAVGLLHVAYEFYFLNKNGTTPGKKSVGLKVVRTNGTDVDRTTVVKRLALIIVIIFFGSLPFVAGWADSAFATILVIMVIMMFTDQRGQTLLDKIADTVVIEN